MQIIALEHGNIYDGTDRAPHTGTVLLHGEVILDADAHSVPADAVRIDCTGLAVAPGFIDVHSHSDLQALTGRLEKQRQGVTTEVVGNCGFSAFPCGYHAGDLRMFANGILCGDDAWSFSSAKNYLEVAQRSELPTGVETLVGHGSLRVAHAGLSQRPLSDYELDAMLDDLDGALVAGALGASTGLMYAPGSCAPRGELLALCKAVARRGKLHCTHMRDYGFRLLEAIDEQLDLARASGCRLQISHLQAVGKANRDLNQRAIEMIEAAHAEGIDVAFDCYPYLCGSTVITQLLPQAALEGGIEALLARLADAGSRKSIARQAESSIANTWDEIFISAVRSDRNAFCVGMSVDQIAEMRKVSSVEAIFQLIEEEQGAVNILEQNQSEENLRANLAHPLALIISDGFYVQGRPHPRLYGTFPEFLARSVRDPEWIPLHTAIYKITGAPAQRFGLSRRGELRPGYWADITIFNPRTIASQATYSSPEQPPTGILHVFRKGLDRLAAERPAQP